MVLLPASLPMKKRDRLLGGDLVALGSGVVIGQGCGTCQPHERHRRECADHVSASALHHVLLEEMVLFLVNVSVVTGRSTIFSDLFSGRRILRIYEVMTLLFWLECLDCAAVW